MGYYETNEAAVGQRSVLMLDMKIINALVVDGTGEKPFRADIGIQGDRIAAVGALQALESRVVLDAAGKCVAPGFIDMHTHSDISMLLDDTADSMLRNGVTTNVCGNCGEGVVPFSQRYRRVMGEYMRSGVIPGRYPEGFDYPWDTFEEYHSYIDAHPPLINMASLIPHGPIRMCVKGMEEGPADETQLAVMRGLVEEGMAAGAFGISTGLAYSPGDLVGEEELTRVCQPLRAFGGIYTTHLRNQGTGIFDALEEAKKIGMGAEIPIHISHLKLADPKMWGQTEAVFQWFDRTNALGVPATFDVYPYTLGCSGILRLLPPWSKEGGIRRTIRRLSDPVSKEQVLRDCRQGIPGWENLAENIGWDNVYLTSFTREEYLEFEGEPVSRIARCLGKDPWEAYLDLVVEEQGRTGILVASMATADMEAIVAHPGSILVSDGAAQSLEPDRRYGFMHPRAYGTQTKVLGTLVAGKKLLTLEEAVKKMTSMPARLLGLEKRGRIAADWFADLVIFDPDTVSDTSTFTHLQRAPVGIDTVVVNGTVALKEGRVVCKNAGRLIRKG